MYIQVSLESVRSEGEFQAGVGTPMIVFWGSVDDSFCYRAVDMLRI